MDDIHARYTQHLRAQARLKTASAHAFVCPYCSTQALPDEDALWQHVTTEHSDHLESLQLANDNGSSLYRKLLRDEALQKGKLEAEKAERERRRGDSVSDAAVAGSNAASQVPAQKKPPKVHHRQGTPRRPVQALADFDPDFSRHNPQPQKGSHLLFDPTKPGSHQSSSPPIKADHAHHSPHPHHQHQQHMPRHPGRAPNQSSTFSTPQSITSPSPEPRQQPHLQPERGILEMPSNARWPNLLLQPDSRPISQEQLAAEVKSIYAGLVMVENKCISVDRAQASAAQDDAGQPSKLAGDHWQALIALHRTLLHEHHDFFLASQHPSASPALKRLAAKYSMPARMWKHGIHSFLELLRRRLPESLDYMLAFIYLAYQMMALLYETVPAFEDTWIECLGDLGRYRMAIEDEDLRDRENWAGVARFWYSKAADKSPAVGRLYHHLAILARPNALQQLFYYSRSLTCVQPFMSARESIMTLLDPILGRTHATYSHADPLDATFIRAHGYLFIQEGSLDKFQTAKTDFLNHLDAHIGRITSKWKEQGVYVAVTNLAALFNYGSQASALRQMYDSKLKLVNQSSQPRSGEARTTSGPSAPSTPPPEPMSEDDDNTTPQNLDLASHPTFLHACRLTFSTLQLVVRRVGDKNVLLHVHVLLAFLFSLASIPYDTAPITDQVPWDDIAYFLNTLARSEKVDLVAEDTSFPRHGDRDTKPLPEDYLLQGQVWSQLYFPPGWFKVAHDEDERSLELASTAKSRTERIYWLGVQIASQGPWLNYDRVTKTWSARSATIKSERNSVTSSPKSSSDAMDIEVYPTPQSLLDESPTAAMGAPEPMEGVAQTHPSSNTRARLREMDPGTTHPNLIRNVILRNYTIFICEKTMLLQQSDVFLMLLESGDWRVVVPENVIAELRSLSTSSSSSKLPAEKALNKIRHALEEGRNLHISDAQGNDLSNPTAILDGQVDASMEVDESAEDVAIGITRRQSDLNAQGAPRNLVSHPDAKPAILVSEDRSTRVKARAAGVASIAGSKIRKFITGQARRPEGPVAQP